MKLSLITVPLMRITLVKSWKLSWPQRIWSTVWNTTTRKSKLARKNSWLSWMTMQIVTRRSTFSPVTSLCSRESSLGTLSTISMIDSFGMKFCLRSSPMLRIMNKMRRGALSGKEAIKLYIRMKSRNLMSKINPMFNKKIPQKMKVKKRIIKNKIINKPMRI